MSMDKLSLDLPVGVHAYLRAADAYVSLIRNLDPKVKSGLKHIWMMQTNHFQMLSMSEEQIASMHASLAALGMNQYVDVAYLQNLICSNITTFVSVLRTMIEQRYAAYQAFVPASTPNLNRDKARKPCYYPNPSVIESLEQLTSSTAMMWQLVPNASQAQSWYNGLRLAAINTSMDLAGVVEARGIEEKQSFYNDRISVVLLELQTLLNTVPRTDFKLAHLPVLQIFLDLAKLAWGDLDPYDTALPSGLSSAWTSLWVSDSTVAAIPGAMVPMSATFAEDDSSIISNKALRYFYYLKLYSGS